MMARLPCITGVCHYSATWMNTITRYPIPRTLLIDSQQLESGGKLKDDFRRAAASQIERFRWERQERSGVQQAHREDRISFTSLTPWPGAVRLRHGSVFNGQWPLPEFSSGRNPARCRVPAWWRRRREAADGGFDVLIACAFNYDAHTTEFESLGRVPVLKARMSADLHMAGELRNTGNGNLFVIFGEPDISVVSG